MSGDEYGTEKEVSVGFDKVAIIVRSLHKLSALTCYEHRDESNIFSRFFSQQKSQFESIWNAPLQRDKICAFADRTGVSAESSVDESKMEIDSVQAADGDVTDTQNLMMDLVWSLDEQTATCEQLSSVSDQQLVSVLCKLSDAGVCHICSLLCSMSASEQSRLGSLVCRNLLLPRLGEKSGECHNRSVVKAFVEFTRTFPHLVCMEVLLPLMLVSQDDDVLEIVSEALAPEHRITLLRYPVLQMIFIHQENVRRKFNLKQTLLTIQTSNQIIVNFMQTCAEPLSQSFLDREPSRIQEWQIPLIESLLSSSCGDLTRRQLVQLLSSSADDLACNSQFAKLLVSVIKHLGPGAPSDVVQQLAAVVSANKSVLKRAAEKVLDAL